MFIKNTWYVAAEPQEIATGRLFGRTLLNEKVVMFRNAVGKVVAFKDACPHRYAPLSKGTLEGSCLRCPYHGALYDDDGKCIAVPGAKGDSITNDVRLTRYPILERYNYIWIWLGDPELAADESSIPEWFSPADPHSEKWNGRHDRFLSQPAYYELINDNLHDVSHTEWVHPDTIGAELMGRLFRMAKGEQSDQAYMKQHSEDRYLKLDFHIEDVQAGPMFHQMMAYQQQTEGWTDNVDWDLTVHYSTPSFFNFHPRTKKTGATVETAIEFASLHAITPETQSSCHYFFYTANNLKSTAEREAEFTNYCADGLEWAFSQDKRLICEQMLRVPDGGTDTESLTAVSFMGDIVPIFGRKMIRKQLQDEQATLRPVAVAAEG